MAAFVRPLARTDDREGFASGNAELDAWFAEIEGQGGRPEGWRAALRAGVPRGKALVPGVMIEETLRAGPARA